VRIQAGVGDRRATRGGGEIGGSVREVAAEPRTADADDRRRHRVGNGLEARVGRFMA
jgi:hypothetical protein